uniref:Uncharacterized protein n=2 Tax=Rhodnius prolixus TaxID=13249 RepID=T1HKD3_RHOPR
MNDPIATKCTKIFSSLWPDEEVLINKEKIIALFKVVLGDLFSEEIATMLIDPMKPDHEGNILLENFFRAFSLDTWSAESLLAMKKVLASAPEVINKLADWKNILQTLGFDLGDTELQSLIERAHLCAADVLNLELSNREVSSNEQEEVHRQSLHIIELLSAKLMKQCLSDEETGDAKEASG